MGTSASLSAAALFGLAAAALTKNTKGFIEKVCPGYTTLSSRSRGASKVGGSGRCEGVAATEGATNLRRTGISGGSGVTGLTKVLALGRACAATRLEVLPQSLSTPSSSPAT